MWVNTRWDKQDYSALGLAPEAPTWGYPLTKSGEQLLRNGAPFYINGHGVHSQVWGNPYSTMSRAEMDVMIAQMAASGVNTLSVMEMESNGLVQSGGRAGQRVSCWDNGTLYSTGKTWAAGAVCYTFDTSGYTRIYRRYVTPAGGVSSGGSSTGPTGTGTGISVGGVSWDYLGPAYQSYAEDFWTGDGTTAGFDYFMDACGRAGIYVMIRFDRWDTVFLNLNSAYALNGSAAGSGGNLANHRMLWLLDGTGGTVDVNTRFKAHVDQWLDRINSVNGKRYGDDHTLFAFDFLNEQGLAKSCFEYSTSGGSNSFDYMCKVGSTNNNATEPVAAVVAWWDAKWLAWFQAHNGGASPSDAPWSKLNTLPVNSYGPAGTMGPNIAARDRYYDGNNGDGWCVQVAQFWRESEREILAGLRDHARSKSSHVLVNSGQSAYVFQTTIAEADLCDNHLYTSSTVTNSNVTTTSITGGSGASAIGATWATDLIKCVFSAAPVALVGQFVHFTSGSIDEVLVVASIATTNVANDTINLTRVGDPGGLTGTAPKASFTVVFPTIDNNYWGYHNEPAGDLASTRMPWYDAAAPGVETNYDRNGGWVGQSGMAAFGTMRDNYMLNRVAICTELGERGIADPIKSLCYIAYTLEDLLQGGSGAFRFTWNNASAVAQGEHSIPGEGSSFLSTQAIALMARNISAMPTYEIAHVTEGDIDALWARKNTAGPAWSSVNGQSAGFIQWAGGISTWTQLVGRKLRLAIDGTSAPSAYTLSLTSTGWTHPELNNAATVGLSWWWYNFGTRIFESPKIAVAFGRLPSDSTTKPLPLSKLQFSVPDGKAWYGLIIWASLDGTELGVGRSALLTWMYPRDGLQVARRHFVDTGPISRVEMLDGDYGNASPDTNFQPGVVMRNGLRVKLTMPAEKAATVIERYGATRTHGAFYKSGALWLNPVRPLIVIG